MENFRIDDLMAGCPADELQGGYMLQHLPPVKVSPSCWLEDSPQAPGGRMLKAEDTT